MVFLVAPAERYKDSYLQAIQEFQMEGRHIDVNMRRVSRNFGHFLRYLRDLEDRRRIRPGRVPATEFWLIDDNEFVGRLSLRHELNASLLHWGGHIGYEIRPSQRRRGYGKEILRLGLAEARTRGLRRVLITCDADNTGSKKIIEHNGGQFENAVDVEGSPVKKLRYWIDIP
ncbi:MAG: GNAT family N-acetyltransferase [Ktedonobacteraceae bacterium]|nr:GNAT family N-acetyltransferase [Ktedonobacteraceae bacterium]